MRESSQSSGIRAVLNVPQARFLALPNKFRAFVSGFGGGKTWVGCASMCAHFWQRPGVPAGYFAPTYSQIRDIFYPTISEVADAWGLRVEVRESNHEVHFYHGNRYRGTVLCRSMDKPESIVGFKIGHAMVDELDVLKMRKAETAWRKIIARMRFIGPGVRNSIDVTTTPEGFRFVHNQFVKQPRENKELVPIYGLVQASTYDNEKNLPDDYISSLFKSYPEQLVAAYVDGQFINLSTGVVYRAYSRSLNHCEDVARPGEPLYIGMDFNVGKMTAIVHVKRDGLPRAVDEIVNAYDTPDMVRKIQERYWRHDGSRFLSTREIRIYPDASGGSRKSVNASTTDIAILKQSGFIVCAPAANPPVKDRVNSMNAMFCNAEGVRRYFVNADTCPTYADCLEQQTWSEGGDPDKENGHDHANDAGGYFIVHDFPIARRIATSRPLSL